MTLTGRRLLLSTAFVVLLTGQTCRDPQTEAMKIFTDQGLVLLEPARDYVKPGGLVVLSKNGHPDYIDPLDDLGTESGTEVNFKAYIEGQTKNRSTGLDFALALIGKIIKVPAGLKYSDGQVVQLGQVECGGQRLASTSVLSLLRKKATADFLKAQLVAHNRTFVVQEIYTAKSLSLKTSSNAAIDVSYGSTGSLPACSVTGSAGTTTGTTDATTTTGPKSTSKTGTGGGKTESAGKEGPTAATTSKQATGTAGSAVTAGATGTTRTGGTTATTGTAGTAAPGGGQGISLGACRNSEFELTLNTTADAIPFAVRLNEVVLNLGGDLEIKYGQFRLPSSLGSSDLEKQTAFVDQENTPLRDLQIRSKNK